MTSGMDLKEAIYEISRFLRYNKRKVKRLQEGEDNMVFKEVAWLLRI